MTTTDWEKAELIRMRHPKTFLSLQHLVASMADCYNAPEKRSFFGGKKQQKAYEKFEKQLKQTVLSMISDQVIAAPYNAQECRLHLIGLLAEFEKAFPNWQDAYAFGAHFLIKREDLAVERLRALMPATNLSRARFTIDEP